MREQMLATVSPKPPHRSLPCVRGGVTVGDGRVVPRRSRPCNTHKRGVFYPFATVGTQSPLRFPPLHKGDLFSLAPQGTRFWPARRCTRTKMYPRLAEISQDKAHRTLGLTAYLAYAEVTKEEQRSIAEFMQALTRVRRRRCKADSTRPFRLSENRACLAL